VEITVRFQHNELDVIEAITRSLRELERTAQLQAELADDDHPVMPEVRRPPQGSGYAVDWGGLAIQPVPQPDLPLHQPQQEVSGASGPRRRLVIAEPRQFSQGLHVYLTGTGKNGHPRKGERICAEVMMDGAGYSYRELEEYLREEKLSSPAGHFVCKLERLGFIERLGRNRVKLNERAFRRVSIMEG
jgi:hypothetical protein